MFSSALRRKFKVKTTLIYFLVISCKIIRCVCHISGNSFNQFFLFLPLYIIFAGFNRALFCETEFLTPGLGDTPSINVILTHLFLYTNDKKMNMCNI